MDMEPFPCYLVTRLENEEAGADEPILSYGYIQSTQML
jgi:hypothetical protein